ncbi:MAG TPA: hypothetical protein VM032_12220, partial [Vicinamibacterales bacterium]|nr:hypothetical protein [Vicinamibacterales bacterium]
MSQFRVVGLGVAVMLAIGGQSLLGRSEQPQSPAAPALAPGAPFDALHFRPLGPASMSGRISDLAVYEANPAIFYVGTAHGGVWKTINNGTTFEAQFQDQGLMSIGDVAISQSNPDLVWVGSGESNNRQSTSWGDGVYKSTDGGKHYVRMGLPESRHINRVLIDPRANDTVFVAATGPLFGAGGERGIYKTIDGGKTWKQVLKVDDDTGANDLAMDPANSQVLYASTYQRRRTACCLNGGGPGSGLWKSIDGGETWTRLKTGIPEGPLGRIAVDVYRKRPNILYSLIEGPTPPAGRGAGGAAGGEGEGPGGAAPAAPQGAGGGRGGAQALNTQPTGLYRSDDSGATWRKVSNANPRPMYFSQVRIDPNDPEVVYLGGVGLHQTLDGGKTIATDVAQPTHDDVHAIWINPANSSHVIIGNDGGLSSSYDMGKTWTFFPNLPVGLFYHVSYDMATPFNVCGGMQDNYDWCGPSQVRGAAGIANHHWTTVQGGDGFVVLQDPLDPRIIYSESQDGNMVRLDRVTGESMSIRPQAATGEAPLRWHWDTPIVHSPHDHKVLYTAANKVFRSADRGLSWVAVSPDLTANANRADIVTMGLKGSDITISRDDGIAAWPAIVSLAESPKKPGVIYTGTDDGTLQVTRDAGKTWLNVIDKVPGVPKGVFVSEVVPSRFDEGTVYATFDGHRQNDYEPYVFVSNDFGQTWRAIVANLKGEVARTLTEDLKNPDVLYLGTETGLFVSVDRGRSWTRIKANLPTVRIDEITLHPRDNAMLLATHGRALWILDHLEPIQEYAAAQASTLDAALFTPPPTAMFRRPVRDRNYEFWGDQTFFGENPPPAAVISWLMKKPASTVALTVTDSAGRQVREISGPALANSVKPGIQSACWDLRVQPVPAPVAAGRGGQGRAGSAEAAGGRQGEAGPATPNPAAPGGGRGGQNQAPNPFGAGCGGAGGGGGFGGGAGGGNPGPYVLGGTYTVALVVDGTPVATKSMRVLPDPEVALTEVQRRKMYDMAMEMHALQIQAAEVGTQLTPFNTRLTELSKEVASRTDVPADVKTSVETLAKEVAALAPKLVAPVGGFGRGGGGGGRGGAPDSAITRAGQAKNGLMATLWPTEGTMKAYADAKTELPKAIAEANAAFAKGATLASSLTKFNVTLTAPQPV